jgi:glycosyltransferase involved in cell wall biosynthesis
LNVLIDASPLGFGVTPGTGRAGIFRAAEGFVLEALRRDELAISVAALEQFLWEVQLLRYDRSTHGALQGTWTAFWEHATVAHDAAASLVDRITAVGETSDAAARMMAELALTNRFACRRPPQASYDIYHSLRPRLTDAAAVSARARLLSVYDIVPLQFPEWCDEGATAWMRAALASVRPDRDGIICNARCVRDEICDWAGLDPADVFVVPLAADRAIFREVSDEATIANALARYDIGNRPYLLSLCTLEPRKNLAHLIRCFGQLLQQPGHDDLQLVLVGAMGWKAGPVLEALASPDVQGRVHVTGFVPDRDLAAIYSGADLFVCVSHYEGFGLPILEAMQCGVPVVSSTGGALPEVAGDAALLVASDDADALVDAMATARLNTSLAARGLRRAADFGWDRTVDLTLDAYRAMLRSSVADAGASPPRASA